MGTMDGIIDTVSAPHPLLPLIGLLKTSGKLILCNGRTKRDTTDVEVVPMDYVNTALDRLDKGDVKYRFVIDVAKTINNHDEASP
ncbi:hypothetical protein PRUPE_6G205500 [Prunus persica]|uniref:Alcohol dehydrogenase-like C-terminal domain-containing protein n=1 Tax=Prunus persica TaxID=3760 RepID=M5WFX1_PRUPE|nr:hypothetical protein PRUPE_6G205500 [Prunus persica]